MLTIDKNEIHLTRGDTAFINPIPEIEVMDENGKPTGRWEVYELKDGDIIIFRLAVNSKTLLEKECAIDLENNKATLTLNPEDTLVTIDGAHFTFIENARFSLGKELEKRAGE